MKEIFEKLNERLHNLSFWTASTFDEDGYYNDDSEEVVDLYKALEIVEQLADEVQQDQAYQFMLLHLDILKRMGINISSKWEDAKQQAEALEQAYLRGRQDEKEASNGGWIPCSERLPEAYKNVLVCEENGEIHLCRYNANIKRFFYDGSDWDIKLSEVIAWQPLPAPFKQERTETHGNA